MPHGRKDGGLKFPRDIKSERCANSPETRRVVMCYGRPVGFSVSLTLTKVVAANAVMQATSINRPDIALTIEALIVGFVAAWPPLHLMFANANLASYYQENIGFRFFMTLRFVEGVPGDFVHPGQGVLLSLIGAVYYVLGKLLNLDLFGQINLFGHLILAVPAIAMLVLAVFIALDRKLDIGVRAALIAVPLVMGLGGPQIFQYNTYVDYMPYAKFLFFLFAWRWLHYLGWRGISSARAAIELGVLIGLMATLKLNYVLWPAGLSLISVFVMINTRPRGALRMGIIGALSVAFTVGGLFMVHYRGSLQEIDRYLDELVQFSANIEHSLGFSLNIFDSESSLFRLTIIFCFLCLLSLGFIRFPFRVLVIVPGLAALAGIAVAMSYWRGGGSGYFEAVVMVSLLCVLATASLNNSSVGRSASFGLAAVFVLWPVSWVYANWQNYQTVNALLPRLSVVGDWQRGLFNWNVSRGLPVYVLAPSNVFMQGTVEDMMQQGFTNFAQHIADSNKNPTRRALYPQFHFVFFYKYLDISERSLPPRRLVFMHVTSKPSYPELDHALWDQYKQDVDDLLRGRGREECYAVTHILTGSDIVSCVFSAPG